MKVAIMQPYFFPYIGYFQLINAVDKFIFYDDVTYIKQGWINRNRILLNGKDHFITLKLNHASSFKFINEIEIIQNNEKLIKTINQAYSKAPFFNDVFPLIKEVISEIKKIKGISKIAEISVRSVTQLLNINTSFETSSEVYSHTRNLRGEERVIAICKESNADTYINLYGGEKLYNKCSFKSTGINLFFIKNKVSPYVQSRNSYIPELSIIDVMMFNSPEDIKDMLNNYKLF